MKLTESEQRLVDLSQSYMEKFGECYPVMATDTRSDEEHIAILEECIRSGEKAEKPKLNPDVIY